MKLSVKDIKHVLTTDINVSDGMEVTELDELIRLCVFSARNAMIAAPLSGFSSFEIQQLTQMLENLLHSHESIRRLLRGPQSACAVDASAVARLQVETRYTFCFLLEDAGHVRLFLKSGWKKKYIRFLLYREELARLPRFHSYYNGQGMATITALQHRSFVSDEERRTIDIEQLGPPFGPQPQLVQIPPFPTPMKVIEQIRDVNQKEMLKRLYPEYQHLCSFAHGDAEASLFRAVSDPHSPVQDLLSSAQIEDFYQRQVLEMPVLYSAISSIQAATEVAAIYTADVDLFAKLARAWSQLLRFTLFAAPVYEIRAKSILGVI
jgi:hypothetical protein